jgi:hypothetical protein
MSEASEFPFPTKMVKLADIAPETLKSAWSRANVKDDPCAEYHIGDGWGIVASDVPNPFGMDLSQEIMAFYDPEAML